MPNAMRVGRKEERGANKIRSEKHNIHVDNQNVSDIPSVVVLGCFFKTLLGIKVSLNF